MKVRTQVWKPYRPDGTTYPVNGVSQVVNACTTAYAPNPVPAQNVHDALADSLVAIAVSYVPGESPTDRSVARSAITALSTSGHAGRAMPFPGAFDALVRIYEATSDEPFKGTILVSMINLPERGQVIEFMADAASDPEAVVSVTAVRQLANYLGEAGQVRLRRLYEEDAVVNRTARGHLETIALHFGWGSGGSGG